MEVWRIRSALETRLPGARITRLATRTTYQEVFQNEPTFHTGERSAALAASNFVIGQRGFRFKLHELVLRAAFGHSNGVVPVMGHDVNLPPTNFSKQCPAMAIDKVVSIAICQRRRRQRFRIAQASLVRKAIRLAA
jgi:hypothetical protein